MFGYFKANRKRAAITRAPVSTQSDIMRDPTIYHVRMCIVFAYSDVRIDRDIYVEAISNKDAETKAIALVKLQHHTSICEPVYSSICEI